MNIEKNIEIFIEDHFPAHFRREGPLLVKFMEYYYEWMVQNSNPVGAIRDLTTLSDPDEIADEFLIFLRKEFMSSLPVNLQVDQRLLLKNILNFYQSRGSESSYRLLFRILYNAEINLYYPGDDILRASDGRWTIERYLEVEELTSDAQSIAIIQGKESKAKARIDRIEEFYDDDSVIQKRIYLTNVEGTFQSGEEITEFGKTTVICSTTSALITESGKWIGTYGQLSSNKKLQDNFYYQEFSYEIQSPIGINSYRDIVKNLVHPAGTKLFGKVLGEFSINMDNYIDLVYEYTLPFELSFNVSSQLDVAYETTPYNIEYTINFNSAIVEAGQGKISIGITSLGDLQDVTLGDMSSIPMGLLGNRKLVIGHQTDFTRQVNQPAPIPPNFDSAKLNIFDTDNSLTSLNDVDYTFSPGALLLRNNYAHTYMFKENYDTQSYRYIVDVDELAAMGSVTPSGYVLLAPQTMTELEFYTVDELEDVPVDFFNDKKLLKSTDANFLANATAGDIIRINDTVNGESYYFIYAIYSDGFLSITEPYQYASIPSNTTYTIFSLLP